MRKYELMGLQILLDSAFFGKFTMNEYIYFVSFTYKFIVISNMNIKQNPTQGVLLLDVCIHVQ